jgi:uncharacterized membrane protein HdeD (DUF308 family)
MEAAEEKKHAFSLIPSNPDAALLEGIGILAFGVVLAVWPRASAGVVLDAFGIFALIFGAIQVYDAVSEQKESKWWRIPLAVISIGAGLIALVWPDVTERIALLIVGLWFIITGFLLLVGGLRLAKDISGRWVIGIAGVVALAFGVYLIARRGGASSSEISSSLVRAIGVFGMIEGVFISFYSFLLRKAGKARKAA